MGYSTLKKEVIYSSERHYAAYLVMILSAHSSQGNMDTFP
jgi:hypothetical protein